jgi:hypothetical protein
LISTMRPFGVIASQPLFELVCSVMSNNANAATSPSVRRDDRRE